MKIHCNIVNKDLIQIFFIFLPKNLIQLIDLSQCRNTDFVNVDLAILSESAIVCVN